MYQKWFYYIILIALIFSGCKSKIRKSEPVAQSATVVIVTPVRKIIVGNEIVVSGNIEGLRTAKIGFMVAGKIDYVAVNEGQWVNKDKVLASIDPTSYSIAKEMADVQVAQAEDEYNRLKYMHDQGSISESDFSKITFALQQAKAQQKLHAKNLADTKLYPPFGGVLIKKLCEVGEITGVGIPQFVISYIHKVNAAAFVPESELHQVRIGQNARVSIPAINLTVTGKIVEVGAVADPASRAFAVKVEIDNPQLLIRPGMVAEVVIPSTETTENLVVPSVAILNDIDNQRFVFVADTMQHKAFKRVISTGKLQNENMEILTGLSENELIVTGGQNKLVDGTAITIQKQ